GDTAGPGGDGALGIAGALGAQRRQFPAQALGLKGGDSGLGLQRAAGQQQHGDWFEHGLLPGTGVPSCGTAWRAVVPSRRYLGVIVVVNDYQCVRRDLRSPTPCPRPSPRRSTLVPGPPSGRGTEPLSSARLAYPGAALKISSMCSA